MNSYRSNQQQRQQIIPSIMETKNKNYKKLNVEKCLSLIKAIRGKPVLWKKSSIEFKNKRKHDIAWKEIAALEGYSVQEAKQQWQVLLSCYRTYKAKVRKSLRTGTDANEVYTPCWFAYKPMKFISVETEDSTLDSLSEDRSLSPLDRKSPVPDTLQKHKYAEEDTTSCSHNAMPFISTDSVLSGAKSQQASPIHNVDHTFIKTEATLERPAMLQLEQSIPTPTLQGQTLLDLFEQTPAVASQHLPRTSAVIGNEIARWIEKFEPQQQNLAIGNLYIAMHQIERDIASK
ncbi:uncharacterized protein LOC126562476 [Anopheles maculipalpis]|uniref:uncharacterized protein LOC126562476 n=1 Tax=Anopheles maculipalpis TaxID=1496333 RepID=UPI002158C938|nr:uncharacterized protein LOC126562476 [Anopheles maculipalpis]